MENRLNIWIRFLVPSFLALFLGLFIFMLAQFREPPAFAWYGFVWFVGSIFLIWEIGWWISKKLDKQFPWRQGTFKRLSIQLLTTNLFGIALFLGSFILLNFYENQSLGHDNPLGYLHFLVVISEAFIIVQLINSIQISYQLLQNWQLIQLEAENYKKESIVARLENVRQQIDPHFLKENIADLETLIATAPDKATQFLKDLSDNYQNNQTLLDSSLINVQEELKIDPIESKKNNLSKNDKTKIYKKRFLVKSGVKFFLIPIDQIAIFYKDEIILLYTKDGRKYSVDYSLEELTTMLDPTHFFRINRQHIIHSLYLGEMRSENNQLFISLNVPFYNSLIVSQRNVTPFKKWMNEG